MKIWQYTRLNTAGVGGVETHIAQVSESLRRRGHEVFIGANPPNHFDIAHSHGDTWPHSQLLLRRTKKSGRVWVPVCHGTTPGRMIACNELFSLSGWRGSFRDFLPTQLADAAIAVSQTALNEARRYFHLRLKTKVVSNGADLSVFKPLAAISEEPRLIFIGRGNDRVKNTDALLQACTKIAGLKPSFELLAAPGLHLNLSFVKNLGPTFGRELAQQMARCRALVLTSKYEGDPIVLRESMALGLPVVASELPQLKELLANYTNVFWINPLSVDSITNGISNLLSKKSLTPSPVLRGWDDVAQELEAFYLELYSPSKKSAI